MHKSAEELALLVVTCFECAIRIVFESFQMVVDSTFDLREVLFGHFVSKIRGRRFLNENSFIMDLLHLLFKRHFFIWRRLSYLVKGLFLLFLFIVRRSALIRSFPKRGFNNLNIPHGLWLWLLFAASYSEHI